MIDSSFYDVGDCIIYLYKGWNLLQTVTIMYLLWQKNLRQYTEQVLKVQGSKRWRDFCCIPSLLRKVLVVYWSAACVQALVLVFNVYLFSVRRETRSQIALAWSGKNWDLRNIVLLEMMYYNTHLHYFTMHLW